MPKCKTLESEKDKERLLIKVIKGYQAYCGYTNEEIAKALGVSARTYYYKLLKPSSLSIEEVRRLREFLGIDKDEMAKAIFF